MIKTLYFAVRVDHVRVNDGHKACIEALGYTEDQDEGLRLIEQFAAKDAHGHTWDYKIHGDPCIDLPEDPCQVGKTFELPAGRFMMWDDDIASDDRLLQRPSSVMGSISVYSSKTEDPDRPLLRSYQLLMSNVCPADLRKVDTEGDREMYRQIQAGGSTL